ncbi:transcriptional regulator [Shewanella sp. MSW]|nr:transcriptional regulator [Shewanella sp. MSW]
MVSDFLDEFALIPGYRIQVSAGNGSLNPDQREPVRHLAFRRKWLKFRGFNEKDLAIVWAKGDSMEPTISNNDTLVVHLGRNKPADGHIYIFRNGDELFVKRYQSMLGTWRLISDNALYSPLDITKQDQHQFEVVGQVVHIAKDIGD